jgi:hypothetical protein
MTPPAELETRLSCSHDREAPLEEVSGPLIPNWGRLILGAGVGIGVTVIAIALLSPNIAGDVEAAGRAAVKPAYLLGALACLVVYLAADAWSLVVMAKACCRVSTWGVIKIALEAHFVGGVSSFGGLEIPYQVVTLRRLGMSGSQATSVVLVKGLIHAVLLVLFALAALLPWVDSPITSRQRWLILIIAALLLGVGLFARLWTRRPFGLGLLPQRIGTKAREMIDALRAFDGSVWTYAKLIGLQLVYWAAMFGVLLYILYALGWQGSIVPIVAGQAVMQVLMPLSPLPGGAGVAEFTYVALIGPSTPAGTIVSSLVLWRVVTFVLPVAIGGMFLGLRGARRGR